jgi:hypothetical protein
MAYVTKSEFAALMGLHKSTISKYIRGGKLDGCIKDGKIHVEKGKAAVAARVAPVQQGYINTRWGKNPRPTEQEVKEISAEAGLGFNMSLSDAQTKKTIYDAALKKLEYDSKSGDMMERDKVKKDTQGCAALIKSQLISIPDRLSAVIAAELGVAESSEVKKLIKTEINKALDSLNVGLMNYCD